MIAIATCNLRLLPPESVPASLLTCSPRFMTSMVRSTNFVRILLAIPLTLAKKSKFSITVSDSNKVLCCGQYPINLLALLNQLRILKPPTETSPLVGTSSFVKLLNVVVFPAPFTPSKAKQSPKSNPKEALCTATVFEIKPVLNTFLYYATLTCMSFGDKPITRFSSFWTSSSIFVNSSKIFLPAESLRVLQQHTQHL